MHRQIKRFIPQEYINYIPSEIPALVAEAVYLCAPKRNNSSLSDQLCFYVVDLNSPQYGSYKIYTEINGPFILTECETYYEGKKHGPQIETHFADKETKPVATKYSRFLNGHFISQEYMKYMDHGYSSVISFAHNLPPELSMFNGLKVFTGLQKGHELPQKGEFDQQRTDELRRKIAQVQLEDNFKYLFGLLDGRPDRRKYLDQVATAAARMAPN